MAILREPQQLEAVHAFHANVGDEDRDVLFIEKLQRRLGVRNAADVELRL
jgi:hypothetical protein